MAAESDPPAWKNPMAWLPHSIAEAALSGNGHDVELPAAWAHLQERLEAATTAGSSTRAGPVRRPRCAPWLQQCGGAILKTTFSI